MMRSLKNLLEDARIVWEVYQAAIEMALAFSVSVGGKSALENRRRQGKMVAEELEDIIQKDPAFPENLDQCLQFLSMPLSEDTVAGQFVSECVVFVRLTLLAIRCDLDLQPGQREDWIKEAYESSAPNIRELWPKIFRRMPRLL